MRTVLILSNPGDVHYDCAPLAVDPWRREVAFYIRVPNVPEPYQAGAAELNTVQLEEAA
jgi:hypothetical protein